MASSLPAIFMMMSAMWFMDTISSDPMLSTCAQCHSGRVYNGLTSWQSETICLMMPTTQSSMYVKDRVCLPSPHIGKDPVLAAIFRQKAAVHHVTHGPSVSRAPGAFSRPPRQVP